VLKKKVFSTQCLHQKRSTKPWVQIPVPLKKKPHTKPSNKKLLNFKELEKQEQTRPEIHCRKWIIQIRVEINEIKTKNTEKNQWNKEWFFQIKKLKWQACGWTKERRDKIQIKS
jgi:hypothetical protein